MLKKPCKFSHLPSPCLGFITNFKRLIESYLTNDDIIYMNVERARNYFRANYSNARKIKLRAQCKFDLFYSWFQPRLIKCLLKVKCSKKREEWRMLDIQFSLECIEIWLLCEQLITIIFAFYLFTSILFFLRKFSICDFFSLTYREYLSGERRPSREKIYKRMTWKLFNRCKLFSHAITHLN